MSNILGGFVHCYYPCIAVRVLPPSTGVTPLSGLCALWLFYHQITTLLSLGSASSSSFLVRRETKRRTGSGGSGRGRTELFSVKKKGRGRVSFFPFLPTNAKMED
ncbi:Lipase_3 domain-containing protein [Psidium guajava]|nr:Lipase_3 domain-containing protein [Psidium guajava]